MKRALVSFPAPRTATAPLAPSRFPTRPPFLTCLVPLPHMKGHLPKRSPLERLQIKRRKLGHDRRAHTESTWTPLSWARMP
jgi:hypothetical protein